MYKSKQCYGAEEHLDGGLATRKYVYLYTSFLHHKKLVSSFTTHLPKSGASKSIFAFLQFS